MIYIFSEKKYLARQKHLRKMSEWRIYLCRMKRGKLRLTLPKEKTAARKVQRARNLTQVEISLWFKTGRPGKIDSFMFFGTNS